LHYNTYVLTKHNNVCKNKHYTVVKASVVNGGEGGGSLPLAPKPAAFPLPPLRGQPGSVNMPPQRPHLCWERRTLATVERRFGVTPRRRRTEERQVRYAEQAAHTGFINFVFKEFLW
jgi:hypothetical protein